MTDGEGRGRSGDVDAVRDALVSWYEADHRAFPWRETTDPYEILVSEVMSQQTQLSRVEEAWAAFLERWPTTADLAAADRADVVGFWSANSLGYNNRAKYLHEAAQQVETDYAGEFPETPGELSELMGVGPYTANAVASFAFDNGDAVVDTNVKRVLYRAFDVPDDDSAFEEAANELMPEGSPASGTTPSWNWVGWPAGRRRSATRLTARGASGAGRTPRATSPRPTSPAVHVRGVGARSGAASSARSANTATSCSTNSVPGCASTTRQRATAARCGSGTCSRTSKRTDWSR